MSISFADAAKAKALREYFAKHGRIYIAVDATGEDVRVPEQFRGDPALRLVLNVRMPQPIHIRDDALESNFSFGGVPFPCHIPMRRIWAAWLPEGDLDQGLVWEDDVPEIIRAVVEAMSAGADQGPPEEDGRRPKEEGPDDKPKAGRKVRHLRVVK
ncbi:MAG: ClpXP protease specificity-enhancing factor SspB [Mariprofundaceae bacterium]